MSIVPPPVFALTMGDPAGIGPEIALKALTSKKLGSGFRIAVIGDLAVMKAAAKSLKAPISATPKRERSMFLT
jgi:4-hydroxy-L-threonine phosphate dehydrogenase PdxA